MKQKCALHIWGQFHPHFCAAFSQEQDEKPKFGKRQTGFGKMCNNLSLKLGVLILGEIEQRFLCQTLFADNFLVWQKSLVKLIPKLTKSVYSAEACSWSRDPSLSSISERVLFSSFFCLFNDVHSLGMFDMKMKGKEDDESNGPFK